MADVRDRGQLILILGLLLAVMFVVLALLLNTVIFTENLASRGTDVGGRDALEHRQVVVDAVGELIDEENANDYETNASVRENVTDGIDEFDRLLRLRRAERGTAVNVSNVTLHNGSVLRQNDSDRNMSSSSGAKNWTLATEINDTRRFVVNVTGGLNTSGSAQDGFNISLIGDGGKRWSMYIYDDGGPKVAVQNGSEAAPGEICSSGLSVPFTVNLTAETVNGTECSALEFAKGIDKPYDITYTFANWSTGTYNLTVNVSGAGAVDESNFNAPGNGQPYNASAVYSVALDVYYENAKLTYRARVRIAPGEPS